MQIPDGEEAAAKAPPISLTSPAAAGRQIVDAVQNGTFRVTIGKDARMLDRIARVAPRRAIESVADRIKPLLG